PSPPPGSPPTDTATDPTRSKPGSRSPTPHTTSPPTPHPPPSTSAAPPPPPNHLPPTNTSPGQWNPAHPARQPGHHHAPNPKLRTAHTTKINIGSPKPTKQPDLPGIGPVSVVRSAGPYATPGPPVWSRICAKMHVRGRRRRRAGLLGGSGSRPPISRRALTNASNKCMVHRAAHISPREGSALRLSP